MRKSPALSKFSTFFLIILCFSGLIYFLLTSESLIGSAKLVIYAIPVLIPFSLLSQLRPDLTIVGLLIWIPIRGFLTHDLGLLPDAARQFSDVLLLLLLTAICLQIVLRRVKLFYTPIDLPLFLFVCLGFLSIVINRVNPLYGILGLYRQISFVILYYAIVHLNLKEHFLRRLYWIVVATALIQTCVTIVQFFLGERIDGITGTLGKGQANGLGHMLSIFFLLFFGVWLFTKKQPERVNATLHLAILLIPLVLCSSRFSYIALVIILAWLLRKILRPHWFSHFLTARIPKAFVISAASFLLLISLVAFLLSSNLINRRDYSITQLYKDQFILERGSGRLLYYPLAWEIITRSAIWGAWIGVGPGTFTSYTGELVRSQAYRDLIRIYADQLNLLGFDASVDSSYISMGGEFGLMGLGLFLIMLFRLYKTVNRTFNKLDGYWRSVSWSTMGAIIFFILAGLVGNVWETQSLSVYVWLLAGLSIRAYRHHLLKTGQSAIATRNSQYAGF